MWKSLITGAALVCLATPGHAQCAAPKNLNGLWKANDGGNYWIRQVGNNVWWVEMSGDGGQTFTNVFRACRKV
jgi:hypothetical protein